MPAARDSRFQQNWQQALAEAYDRPETLLRDLGLKADAAAAGPLNFAMRVPRGFAARMRRGDPEDPLLLQVLPSLAEKRAVPGYGSDPVGDLASVLRPGLLHKYAGRALVISTGACAVHCRYCFRREFPYSDQSGGIATVPDILAAVAADQSLGEVILSGGDPLSLSDRRLGEWLKGLDSIPHVRRIRLHTRTPIVLPERVDKGLVQVLATAKKPLVIVVHSNHANEIDDTVVEALRQLRQLSWALLNQAVLLRGINDSADALAALSETLFDAGVLPYYLHQLDPVAGAAHFAVPDAQARDCVQQAAARLPGFLVPRLVREQAGAEAKLPL